MEKRDKIYEGKAKILYRTSDPALLVQYFKDDATAFNAQKRGVIPHKGEVNCAVSSTLFRWLETQGVRTHFVEQLGPREMLVRAATILPLEVVVRNVVAGSLAKRMGLEEGGALAQAIVEYYYKRDDLGDPMVNEDHVRAFALATAEELAHVRAAALRVNGLLVPFFADRSLRLVDFKLEFGRAAGEILLCDEITPDGARLWDAVTGDKLDKDRFRRDLGRVEESYAEVRRRICG
jgi:phosphoribosylaminoimidazole-succinocarboxamide synthase